MQVVLADYDPSSLRDFEHWRSQILSALDGLVNHSEHIGSTAVPGLAAKAVVDILIEVGDVTDTEIRRRLENAGFDLVVDEPAHRMFRPADRRAHVHLWATGDPEIDRHLLFRDWLRTNEADRKLYESEKRRLAAREWLDQNEYAQAKSPLINAILARAKQSVK